MGHGVAEVAPAVSTYDPAGAGVHGSFPVAERCAGEFVSLPMYPELSEQQVSLVIDAVTETLGAGQPA